MLTRYHRFPGSTLPQDPNQQDYRAHDSATVSLQLEIFEAGSAALWIWHRGADGTGLDLLCGIAGFASRRFDREGTAFVKKVFETGEGLEPLLDYVREQFPDRETAIERLLVGC